MNKLLMGILLVFPFTLEAQIDCDCTKDLNFIINYYEKNLPGFKDNVTSANQSEYEAFKRELIEESRTKDLKVECFKIATYYVEYFQDNHSGISMEFLNVDESDPEALNSFLNGEIYQSREIYALSKDEIRQYPMDDIRGIYQTMDSAYTILVIPNNGAHRQFIGVILESKSKLWKRGQVKLEINTKKGGGYEAFSYLRNHSLRYQTNFAFENGVMGNAWFKTSKDTYVDYSANNDRKIEFRHLNDSTTYLRIPTFSGDASAAIDSLFEAADPEITLKPYLIVDVRNNGGGSDKNAGYLLKYIYTRPIPLDVVDLYVTEDNIKIWENWYQGYKDDPKNYGKGDLKWIQNEIKKMKRAPLNTFIPRSKGGFIKRKMPKPGPKKVAILYNRGCASACESLLFWSKASDKTIMVGENSGGYVGYGEVGTIQTPCYQYYLRCTMTRYQNQRAFEVIGVAPEFRLDYDRDWVEQTFEILQNK